MCTETECVESLLNEVLIDDDSRNSEGEEESENDSEAIQMYGEAIGALKNFQQFARNNYQIQQLKNI